MAATILEICNQALLYLGAQPITELNDTGTPNRYCNALYAQCRKELLQRHPWGFAIQEAELVEQSDDAEDTTWGYGFDLPEDYLRALLINGDRTAEFQVRGGYLWCDSDEVTLRYIFDEDTVTVFPPLFVAAYAYLIASRIALPITGDAKIVQTVTMLAVQAFHEAATADANSEQQPQTASTRHIADSRQ